MPEHNIKSAVVARCASGADAHFVHRPPVQLIAGCPRQRKWDVGFDLDGREPLALAIEAPPTPRVKEAAVLAITGDDEAPAPPLLQVDVIAAGPVVVDVDANGPGPFVLDLDVS